LGSARPSLSTCPGRIRKNTRASWPPRRCCSRATPPPGSASATKPTRTGAGRGGRLGEAASSRAFSTRGRASVSTWPPRTGCPSSPSAACRPSPKSPTAYAPPSSSSRRMLCPRGRLGGASRRHVQWSISAGTRPTRGAPAAAATSKPSAGGARCSECRGRRVTWTACRHLRQAGVWCTSLQEKLTENPRFSASESQVAWDTE